MNRTVYLAGPMTGIDQFNYPMFRAVAADLRKSGYTVVSPVELDEESEVDTSKLNPHQFTDEQRAWFLRRDVERLVHCDGIVLMPGWFDSAGVTLELIVALSCGLEAGIWAPEDGRDDPVDWSSACRPNFPALLHHISGVQGGAQARLNARRYRGEEAVDEEE